MDVSTVEKEPVLKKSVGRISRLFQKKGKKMAPSVSSLSFNSEPSLSIVPSQHKAHSINSTLNTEYLIASHSIHSDSPSLQEPETNDSQSMTSTVHHTPKSYLSRNNSNSNKSMDIQQLIQQRQQELKELDSHKSMIQIETTRLRKELLKIEVNGERLKRDMDKLNSNYKQHLLEVRGSDDTLETIKQRLVDLRHRIQSLAVDILPYAEPVITTEKLCTLWVNLKGPIEQLGTPLPLNRIQMLTEKFMMDVLVQNLNTNIFPGLSCNQEYNQLQSWFNRYDSTCKFPTRLRQEVTMILSKKRGQDIEDLWKKCVDRTWNHLYRGLQKSYPLFLTHHSTVIANSTEESPQHTYSHQLRSLVEDTILLGSIIKGQDVHITAVDVKEGSQLLDTELMDDDDGSTKGVIAFCISPPFVAKVSHHYEPLLKGRVLCRPADA
ncbi:hypothetical protein BDB01DRAFT_784473 [Pilobolus umbonatus]|nr:hypothetical protein BDB01DRAFT_784473 [Pilobolus umbonatus]